MSPMFTKESYTEKGPVFFSPTVFFKLFSLQRALESLSITPVHCVAVAFLSPCDLCRLLLLAPLTARQCCRLPLAWGPVRHTEYQVWSLSVSVCPVCHSASHKSRRDCRREREREEDPAVTATGRFQDGSLPRQWVLMIQSTVGQH